MKAIHRCPHCNAKMIEYKFSLNKGLIACLHKLYTVGGKAEVSKLGLSNSQYVNFQKLAWWGLVRKIAGEDEIEKRRGGKWGITKRGIKFLHNEIPLDKFVFTYRGEVQRKDGPLLFVTDVKDGYKYRLDYIEESSLL
jgi:hypothetical protein